MKKIVCAMFAFLLMSSPILTMLGFNLKIDVGMSSGYTVHNLNTGLDYAGIQVAIDAPETLDGHTIYVENGVYYENVVVDKALSLTGENKETTIIDGNHAGNVVTITASSVNIAGFTIRNSGANSNAGILIGRLWDMQSFGNNISGNVVMNNYYGILLAESFNSTVSSNIVTNNTIGVQDQSRDYDCDIWIMNADGSNQTLLTTDELWDDGPEWCPNDSKILFERISNPFNENGMWDIWVMNTDGSNQIQLTTDSEINMLGGWSPNCSLIVYNSRKSGDNDIWIMDSDGTNQRQLTTDLGTDSMPTWSPDGTRIAFISNRTGNQDMWIMKTDGTSQTQLTSDIPSVLSGSWSPDSSKIVFHSIEDEWNGNWDIWTINSDGTNPTKLFSSPYREAFPHWSPDGTKIAYGSDEAGNWDVWIMNSDGTNRSRITTEWDTEEICSWSPDGSKLAFARAEFSLPSYNRISNNIITDNEQEGAHLQQAVGVSLEGNLIQNNGHGVFLVESNSNEIVDNVIANNTRGIVQGIVGFGLGIYMDRSSRNYLRNNSIAGNFVNVNANGYSIDDFVNDMDSSNTLEGRPLYYWVNQSDREVPVDAASVFLVNCTNILVEDISTISNNGAGIAMWATSNSTVRNVTASGICGISLQLSNENILENNTASGHQAAILLQNSGNNTLRDNKMGMGGFSVISGGPWVWLPGLINDVDESNTIHNKPIYYWISQHDKTVPSDGGLVLLVSCSEITVRDLNISSNIFGIALYETEGSVIENDTVRYCANGIVLAGSNNTVISDCRITDGVYWSTGIFLHTSNNNTLTGNTISNMVNQQQPGQPPMGVGIAMFMANGNKVYHNNFVNNTVSASVQSSIENVFDNGYIQNGFGNYWSDYSGTDLFCGPYQNITGEDRIGDTPYVIDANNKDNYPLMLPWVNRFELYDCVFLVFGSSMSPTILAKDWIWVKNTTDPAEITPGSYPLGDIVVHKKPGDPSVYIVRRVVAKWYENDTWYFTVKSDGGSQGETTIPLSLLVGKVVALLRPFHIDYKGRTLTTYIYSNSTLDGFSFDADTKCISFNTTGLLTQGATSYCDVFIPSILLSDLNEAKIEDTTIPFVYEDYGRYLVASFTVDQTSYGASIYGSTMGTAPNISVTDVAFSKTVIGEGYTGNISVRVENQGDFPETFNVTLFANSTIVETVTVTVPYKSSLDVSFVWNTTGFARGSYALTAVAEPVAGEMETGDNTLTDGSIFIAMPGDINADRIVDIFDIATVALAFGSTPSEPNWNPVADINNDGTVDIFDLVVVALHFGETG